MGRGDGIFVCAELAGISVECAGYGDGVGECGVAEDGETKRIFEEGEKGMAATGGKELRVWRGLGTLIVFEMTQGTHRKKLRDGPLLQSAENHQGHVIGLGSAGGELIGSLQDMVNGFLRSNAVAGLDGVE